MAGDIPAIPDTYCCPPIHLCDGETEARALCVFGCEDAALVPKQSENPIQIFKLCNELHQELRATLFYRWDAQLCASSSLLRGPFALPQSAALTAVGAECCPLKCPPHLRWRGCEPGAQRSPLFLITNPSQHTEARRKEAI